MRRGNHPDAHAESLRTPYSLEFLILKHAQELDLRCQRNIPDLIKKQRSGMGVFQSPFSRLVRPREGSPFMPEQGRFTPVNGVVIIDYTV